MCYISCRKHFCNSCLSREGAIRRGVIGPAGGWIGGAGPEQNDTTGAVRGALPNTKRLSVKSVYHSGLTAQVLVPKSIL